MNLHACVAAALLHATYSVAATVSIDTNTTYQTIEGLGAFAEVASAYTPQHAQFLHDDLGLTMLRVFIEYDMEPTNDDNAEPNSTDLLQSPESFYRLAVERGPEAWNSRVDHMSATVNRLTEQDRHNILFSRQCEIALQNLAAVL